MQQRDAVIMQARTVHHQPIDRAARDKVAIGRFLLRVRDHAEHHVVTGTGIHLARTGDEIRKDRVDDLVAGRERDDMADCARLPGGKAFGAGVGVIIGRARRVLHALACLGVHLWIAVQRPADRGRGQAKLHGQFLESNAHDLFKPY